MLTINSYVDFFTAGLYFALGLSALSNAAAAPIEQTAVFAGGCFWGVDAVFKHVKGVTDVVSGYSGGSAATAHYEMVSQGDTGHAESVRVRFDPAQVSYQQLLQVFFSVAHDPTELNRQGPDTGSQYRSAIFYTSAGAAEDSAGLHPATHRRAYFFRSHRHAGRAAAAVLPGRGASPELSGIASIPALYRIQRHAQAGAIARKISNVIPIIICVKQGSLE